MKRTLVVGIMLIAVNGNTCGHTQPSPSSIEMSELVILFMLPGDERNNIMQAWHIGAEQNSPIEWYTRGIENSPAYAEQWGSYYRRGDVVITIDDDVTHQVLEERLVPGKWDIYLFGPRIGVTVVSIISDLAYEFEAIRPSSVLSEADMLLSEYRCTDSARATGGNIVYRIEATDKKPAWLEEWWSCGSAGCSFTLNLFLFQEDADEVECADW